MREMKSSIASPEGSWLRFLECFRLHGVLIGPFAWLDLYHAIREEKNNRIGE